MDEAFSELEEIYLEALVEWGSEFQNNIIDLRKCRGELLVAIQQLLSRYKDPDEENWMNEEEKK
ncbi:hypothetical protein CRYPA_1576 [uncultured Candidatus Thioglobus sp.]|nr:hypothetical protein CRYPA_1576 [uncultured Candidatus Thioglobus sp.]